MLPSALVTVAYFGRRPIFVDADRRHNRREWLPSAGQLNRNQVSGADRPRTGNRRNRSQSPAAQDEAVLVDTVLPDAILPDTVRGIAIPGGACMRRGDHDQSDSSSGKKRSHGFSPFRLVFTVGDWDLMRQPRPSRPEAIPAGLIRERDGPHKRLRELPAEMSCRSGKADVCAARFG